MGTEMYKNLSRFQQATAQRKVKKGRKGRKRSRLGQRLDEIAKGTREAPFEQET